MSQTVRFEKQDSIAIVTIDRPEALNALNGDVIAELEQVVTALENDRDVRCMILTGEGRSFVAGADIGEQYPLDLDGGRRWGQRGSALFRRIEKLEFPTIAAVNGFALGGGCELPSAATSSWPPKRPSSASLRWVWASPPASPAPSACPAV